MTAALPTSVAGSVKAVRNHRSKPLLKGWDSSHMFPVELVPWIPLLVETSGPFSQQFISVCANTLIKLVKKCALEEPLFLQIKEVHKVQSAADISTADTHPLSPVPSVKSVSQSKRRQRMHTPSKEVKRRMWGFAGHSASLENFPPPPSEASFRAFLRTRSSWLGTVGTELLRINSAWTAWWPFVIKWPDFSRGEQHRVVQGEQHTAVSTGTCLLNNSSEAGEGDWVHSGCACAHQHGFMKVKSCLTNLITICSEKTGSVNCGEGGGVFLQTLKKKYLNIISSYKWLLDSKLKLFCTYFPKTNVNFVLNTKYYLLPCHGATWIKYC